MKGSARFLLAVLAALATGSEVRAQTHVFRDIDIYRSRDLSRDTLLVRYAGRIDAVRAAIDGGDMDAIEVAITALGRRIRDDNAFAALGISPIQYPRGDTLEWYLTVDAIDSIDAGRLDFDEPPRDTIAAADQLIAAWYAFEQAGWESGAFWAPGTACPAWHCVFSFETPATTGYDARFRREVSENVEALLEVLRHDHRPAHRAAAAYLIAHLDDPEAVVSALLGRLRDPSSHVRNNAMRVLAFMTDHRGWTDVPLDPVIKLLDGPTTTDRNKALAILRGLARNADHGAVIRRRAGPTLLGLLGLQQPNNHELAHAVLRELSGQDFAPRDYDAWGRWLARTVRLPRTMRPARPRRSGVPRRSRPGLRPPHNAMRRLTPRSDRSTPREPDSGYLRWEGCW